MATRLGIIIFFYVLISSAYFFQGPSANVNSRLDLALALSESASVKIDRYQLNTIDKSFYNGHFYSDKAPGLSFLGAFVLIFTRPIFQLFDLSPRTEFLSKLYLLTFLLMSVFTAWTASRFFKLAVEILGETHAFLAFSLTALCFTGTLVFAYSTVLFAHQMAGNILFLSFYYLRQLGKLSRLQYYALASLLAFACLLEYTVTPFFALTYLYLCYQLRKKESFFIFLPLGIVALLFAWYNTIAFGAPWHLSYGFLHGTLFDGMKSGFFGITLPSLEALYHLTFSEYRGLFYYNPIFLFSFVGLVFAWLKRERRPWLIPCFASFGFLLLTNASYFYWTGGACFGPRHIVPALILLFVPILFLPPKWLRHPGLWCLGLVGVFYDLIATSVVLIPDEKYSSPFWDYLFPLFRNGMLAINTNYPVEHYLQLQRFSAFRSSAYNLGQFFLLPGIFSLIPLLLCQILLLGLAWRWATQAQRTSQS